MPAHQPALSAGSPAAANSRLRLACVVAIGVFAAVLFARGLADTPFVDEYAYISQSYYTDLMFSGRVNDRAWLEFPAFDLVPLPKYLIGLALRTAQIPRPGPAAAQLWYLDTSREFGTSQTLWVARLPSIVMAVLGCLALFAIGAIVKDARLGVIAAILLAINPLYRLHAHRAMSEAPCEALLLLALAVGLWGWKRTVEKSKGLAPWLWPLLAGVLAGLSILAKFNGILTLFCLGAWSMLGVAITRGRLGRSLMLAAAPLAAALAWFVFVSLNPFMTVHPKGPLPPDLEKMARMNAMERFQFLVDHRREMSRGQQQKFSHNALFGPVERAKVVAVQGFGRFGPFGPARSDSTRRFDIRQDWGAVVWLPVVLAGLAMTLKLGNRQRREDKAPTAWALAVWAILSLVVVTAYLPMAWDRYQLPIQSPACLLAAVLLVGIWEGLGRAHSDRLETA